MNNFKTIGIIGGQGPVSTADMYMRIIKYFQNKLGITMIRDYPPMVIYSVPTPDLVKTTEDEKVTFEAISDAVIKLEKDGADFVIIACNSLQFLNDKLQQLIKIPIIGIAPVVCNYLKIKGYKKVGLLASDTTIKHKVYSKYFEQYGIEAILPNNNDQLMAEEVMLNEIGGKSGEKDKAKIKDIITSLAKTGAETVLLACTELPLVIKQKDTEIPLIDCNEVYAVATAILASRG